MVRLYGLVKGYTPIKVNLPESGRVKVNIRTDLLRPAGKTIIGTLHLNGTTVYIPQDANITIGSSAKCDIRIKDPTIQLVHATIHSIGEISATLENVVIKPEGKIAVLTSANKINIIDAGDDPLKLVNGDKVIFSLSGNKKLLPVEFKLRQTLGEEGQTLLIAGLKPRPAIEEVSVEQALARRPLKQEAPPPPSFKTLTAKTPFAGARNIGEALALYPEKFKIAKREDRLMRLAETLALIIPFITSSTTNWLIFSAGISAAIIRVMVTGSYKFKLSWHLETILSKKTARDEAARALAKMNEPERNNILAACEKDPLPPLSHIGGDDFGSDSHGSIANAIKSRLPAAFREIEPPALPLARKRNE